MRKYAHLKPNGFVYCISENYDEITASYTVVEITDIEVEPNEVLRSIFTSGTFAKLEISFPTLVKKGEPVSIEMKWVDIISGRFIALSKSVVVSSDLGNVEIEMKDGNGLFSFVWPDALERLQLTWLVDADVIASYIIEVQ